MIAGEGLFTNMECEGSCFIDVFGGHKRGPGVFIYQHGM